MQKAWTEKELETLRDTNLSINDVAKKLNRTFISVERKRCRERVVTKPPPPPPAPQAPDKLEHQVKLPRPEFGFLPLSAIDSGDWIRLGLCGDTHLCCREERLGELHTQYDLYQSEGITKVFHAGNPVDGYVPRINGGSVFETSIDGQAQYFVDNYPRRKGITTYFITGDDHEGWWMKEGFNFGAYLQFIAENAGRTDLKYIGHVEADVEIRPKGSRVPTIMKIQHPGGGSAYARSYTGQKQVEAFEGGEKPGLLVQGHYHVSNYMNDRNIHVVSLPGFQDQTIFARKKRLRMEIGAAFVEFKVNPDDGAISRFKVEFSRYFTRKYYQAYLKSDRTILKGHLIIKP